MNAAHLHLLLNHIPILGTLGGTLILIYAMFSKNKGMINLVLFIFVITALITIPVFLTGEPSEDIVENMPMVSKVMIEEHEEAAESALWVMEGLGAISLITLLLRRKEHGLAKIFTTGTLLLSLITFGLMAKVGNDGGKIRHVEITNSNVSNAQKANGEDDD